MFNMLGGGSHADNNCSIQEFLIVPTKELSFHEAIETGVSVFYALQKILKTQGKTTAFGYEGCFVSSFANEYEAFDTMMEAIQASDRGENVMISLDSAASYLFDHETGLYTWFGKKLSSHDLIEKYRELIQRYPIFSIEDGLDQTDWNGWYAMKCELGESVK